jgi:hypothetical protein
MKTYLGDAVYADKTDLGEIVLTTEDGTGMPSNIIYLEQSVIESLLKFINESTNHPQNILNKEVEDLSRPEWLKRVMD